LAEILFVTKSTAHFKEVRANSEFGTAIGLFEKENGVSI
jgi:hypothetical protein